MTSALIVVDMQNDFVRAGSPLEVPGCRDLIPAIRQLVDGFHERRQPVVYTRFLAGPADATWWQRWSEPCAPPTRACWPGVMRRFTDRDGTREGIEIVDEFVLDATDVVIDKYHYDAFFRTPLADVLAVGNVTSVVVVGVVTEGCVADTVRGAFCRRLAATVVPEAIAPYDASLTEPVLRNIAATYGDVEPLEIVLGRLDTGQSPPGAGSC